MPILARLSTLLNLTHAERQWQPCDGLSNDITDALETLTQNSEEHPVVALLQSQGAYTIDTDACDKQIGCIIPPKDTD